MPLFIALGVLAAGSFVLAAGLIIGILKPDLGEKICPWGLIITAVGAIATVLIVKTL
jgi:hypothetical protein